MRYPCAECISITLAPARKARVAASANAFTTHAISVPVKGFGVCHPSSKGRGLGPKIGVQPPDAGSAGTPPCQGTVALAFRPACAS